MAGFLGKLRSWFGRKPAPRPSPGRGHRGVAAGNIAKPDLEAYAERLAEGHEAIPEDEVTDFLYNEVPMTVNSTNVANLTYYPKEQKMLVQYLKGGKYLYSNVTEQEALQIVQAHSKGGVIWDLFRVRGSRTAHKKPFVKLS